MIKIKKIIDEILFGKFITKCGKRLLQIATRGYYKLRQERFASCNKFYYKLRQVLQIATGVTNCDRYYKLRQVLQIAIVHSSKTVCAGCANVTRLTTSPS